MAISYPLSLPSGNYIRQIIFSATSTVAISSSPFTAQQQAYVHQGEFWSAAVELKPMRRADAEQWAAFFLALNGRQGTFLMGDPVNTTPQGTWAGTTPLVSGGTQTGKTLIVDGLNDGVTATAGDWFQLSSGSTTRLHKVTQDASASGSPTELSLEIWPRLRESPADGASLTLASPLGQWRLLSNVNSWSIALAQSYGITFQCVEAL